MAGVNDSSVADPNWQAKLLSNLKFVPFTCKDVPPTLLPNEGKANRAEN